MRPDTDKPQAVRNGVVLGARLLIGGVLVWAGVEKLRMPWAFLDAVYAYELSGPLTGAAVAAVLPWVEVMVGLSLLLGIRIGEGLLAAGALLGAFVIAQGSVVMRGLDAPCACFGAAAEAGAEGGGVGLLSILRTSVFAMVALAGWWAWCEWPGLEKLRGTAGRWGHARRCRAGAVTAGAAGS